MPKLAGTLGGVKLRGAVRTGWFPNQHGAWLITFVPILVGVILSGPSWLQLVLAASWGLAYLFFNAFTLALKAHPHRWRRYLPAALTYGILAAAGAITLIIIMPSLLYWGIPLAVLASLALWQTYRRNDRTLLARLSAIIASCLMLPIAVLLGADAVAAHHVWGAFSIMTLYFCGTVPYVKTMIRERDREAWLQGSLSYHSLLVPAAVIGGIFGSISWFATVVAIILFARSLFYPFYGTHRGRPLSPLVVGLSELVYCALAVVAAVLP